MFNNGEKKMKNQKNKSKISAFALVLVLTISAILVALPTINAHDPPQDVTVYLYVGVSQNPSGVNQPLGVITWFNLVPPGAAGVTGDRFKDITIEITKPDGSKDVLGPFYTDPVGTKYVEYTPPQIGTYHFQSIYPGQVWTDIHPESGLESERPRGYKNDTILATSSSIIEVTIQEEVEAYPIYPLPLENEYWERPLYGDIKGWSNYASNWLRGSQFGESQLAKFQPYGAAPDSAHLLWAKPVNFGGIAGDQFGDIPYNTDDYESPWSGGIIINGRLYYNKPMYPKYGFYCVDLRTGEEIWYNNNTELNQYYTLRYGGQTFPLPSFGQLYWYHSINGQGILPYLWITSGSTWYMLDALTGNWLLTMTDVPSGTDYTAPDGSLLRYTYDRNGWLTLWNSSAAIPPAQGGYSTGSQQWKPRSGETINAIYDEDTNTSGYTWNKTAPANLPGSILKIRDDRIIGGTVPTGLVSDEQSWQTYTLWTLSLDPGHEGEQMWKKEYTKPPGNVSIRLFAASVEDNVFVIYVKETRTMYGYDLDTGDLLWGPTEPEGDWNMYTITSGSMGYPAVAYGKLYWGGYDGELRAYDLKTGEVEWKYYAENIGGESPYGQYPLKIGAVADGKIYMYSTEHSPTKPLWRGSRIRCIDTSNGEELWTVLTYARDIAIADGVLVTCDYYSSQIYAFGKGPSDTSVSASPKIIAKGDNLLIEGTVTDQSAGDTCRGIPAAGTPAVADEYMSEWMEYLYMQKPMPMDASGVPVTIDAVDPNGNFINIAKVTSDMSGMFKKMWTPEHEGEYTIIATFEGSDSYFSSYAETAIGVGPPVTPATPIEPEPTEPEPLITTEIAIIAAVAIAAIIGVVAFWALRRRK